MQGFSDGYRIPMGCIYVLNTNKKDLGVEFFEQLVIQLPIIF